MSTNHSTGADHSIHLVCSEIWGGNRPVDAPIELPGFKGILFSQPCDGGRGGDVHYLSVCGSGLLSRICVADVAGHGETVAAIGAAMHAHLRRCMNEPDQRKVLCRLNEKLEALGLQAMTTAAAVTYYPPTQSLSVSYAGHPPAWHYSVARQAWSRLQTDSGEAMSNMPLAIDIASRYTRRMVHVDVGDKLVILTDGVLEAMGPDRGLFGDAGVDRVLQANPSASCEELGKALRQALAAHTGEGQTSTDDVTFVIAEIVPGPAAPPAWLAIRNRVMRPRGHAPGPEFESVAK